MRKGFGKGLLVLLEDIVRRDIDVLASVICLILMAPLFLSLALLVAADGGPVIFEHRRMGRHGSAFNCFKFRTMVMGAEECLAEYLYYNPDAMVEWKRDHKLKMDPRVTPAGRFLRKTSLDELPQIWNVLLGDMTLVGPRPVTEIEMHERYGDNAHEVLSVKPGITGAWQVSGRSDVDYRHRVQLDTSYVRSRRLVTDIRILFQTIPVVFARNGAH